MIDLYVFMCSIFAALSVTLVILSAKKDRRR